MSAKVEIYTTAICAYCASAKQIFEYKSVPYTEIRIDQDPAKLAEMTERTNGARTVPQIFINDESIGGFDELRALEQDGSLDKKL